MGVRVVAPQQTLYPRRSPTNLSLIVANFKSILLAHPLPPKKGGHQFISTKKRSQTWVKMG